MSVFTYSIKKYFCYSKKELWGLILTILILSIIVGLDDGNKKFIWGEWLNNFISVFLLLILIMIIFTASKKFIALKRGFLCEYNPWLPGIFFGLILSLISKGKIWFFLFSGGFSLHHIVKLRVGKYKPEGTFLETALIGIMGPLSVLCLAVIFKILTHIVPTNTFLQKAILICSVFSIVQALPIPPLDGSHLFYYNRKIYVFFFVAFVVTALLMRFFNIFLSILSALIIAVIITILFNMAIEK